MSCGNEITFFRNFRSRVRRTVRKCTCMCSSARNMSSTTVAWSNRSPRSSRGNRNTGSMWFLKDRFETMASCPAAGSSSVACCSMSTAQARHRPECHVAMRSSSSGASTGGGRSSHSDTSTLHSATPLWPRFSSSMPSDSGGTKAGWNVANRSVHSLHSNRTIRVRIVCTARTACSGACFSRTSYFATRGSSRCSGTTTTSSFSGKAPLSKAGLMFSFVFFLWCLAHGCATTRHLRLPPSGTPSAATHRSTCTSGRAGQPDPGVSPS